MKPASLHKKIGAALLSLVLVFSLFYAPFAPDRTPKAHAIFGVGDIVFDPTNFATNSIQTSILDTLNGIAWAAAKSTVQSITRSTVNWINSGFNGSPAFVTDLQQNLNVLSDTVANNFFQQLNNTAISATGFNLKSPFQDQITQQLRANYYKQTGSLLGGAQYNLSNQSSNPQAFLNGDFSQGGFNAFFSANSNPANNPFGAYQLASNALWNQIDTASQQRKLEYQVGKGFLSWRGNCSPSQQATSDLINSSDPIANSVSIDTTNNPIADIALGGDGTGSSVSLSQLEPCYGNPIKTPGSVIESQLEQQLGSGVEQLNLADSINEIVSALMSQLVGQVLGGNGLSGLSQSSSGGGSSYINQSSTDYASQASNLATGLLQTINNDISSLTNYRNDWQKILDAADAAQQSCGANPQITSVVNQATAGVSGANTAIQQETAISKSIQTAASSGNLSQITAATAQYQSFLSSTPSPTDQAYAAQQSADTGSSIPASLYTQMVNAKNACPTGT